MNKITLGTLALFAVATMSGCAASTTPQTDARHGEAMTMLKAQQTINPEASRNTDPVTGLDGKAAKVAIDKYYKSLGSQEHAEARGPAISIGVGN